MKGKEICGLIFAAAGSAASITACSGHAVGHLAAGMPGATSAAKSPMWASSDSPPTGLIHPAGHDLPTIVFDDHNLLNGREIVGVSSECTPLPAGVDLRVTFADKTQVWVHTSNGDHGDGEPWRSPVTIDGPDLIPYSGYALRTGPSNNIPAPNGGPDAWFSIAGQMQYDSRLDGPRDSGPPVSVNETHTFLVKLECADYSV